MSYDLRIWSALPITLPDGLPERTGWLEEGTVWVHRRRQWQIVATSSLCALPEDVPDEVHGIIPGVAYLAELSLEPIFAGPAAMRLLMRTGRALAKAAHGVIEDPQEEAIITPSGTKRYQPLPPSESASLLSMSWWSVQGDLALREDASALLDVLQSVLPDALPRRYGLYEPPQHLYAETGRLHLEEFLKNHLRDGVVWYPHPPLAHVYVRVPDHIGWNRIGFRTAQLEIEIDLDFLTQPGWQTALRTAWDRISRVVQPFYGDVRILRGYSRSRGRYWWVAGGTEDHPVKAWWWRGIPAGPAQAIVVGEPYRSLWPSLPPAAPDASGLVFVSTEDWAAGDDVYATLPPPPDDIVQPARERYPRTWPFAPRP